MLPTERYRWLTLGDTYAYRAAPGKGLDSRRGTPCRVLILPRPGTKPGNVLVEFLADGVRHIVPAGVLKAVRA